MGRKKYDDDALRELALRYYEEGKSYREIADLLGCSKTKVYELLRPYTSLKGQAKRVGSNPSPHAATDRWNEIEKRVCPYCRSYRRI